MAASKALKNWCTKQLGSQAHDWLFGGRDLWGRDQKVPLAIRTLTAPPLESGDRKIVAWILRELESRIATQTLSGRSGVEKAALDSVYRLFPGTRAVLEKHASESLWASDVLWWMLNRDVRPFTAHWHRYAEMGLLQNEDQSERFRKELRRLQKGLRFWAMFYRAVLTGTQIEVRKLPKKNEIDAPLPSSDQVGLEHLAPRDGLAIPIPLADHFKAMMKVEEKALLEWRQQLDRKENEPVTGIALSGGGIRAATIALGVLRALANQVDVLGVDYLSTVSGGGYTGTMLSSGFARGLFNSNRLGAGPLYPGCYGGPFEARGDIAAALIGRIRARSHSMQFDLKLAGTAFVDVITDQGASAREYRDRLIETWLFEPGLEEANLFTVQSAKDGHLRATHEEAKGPLHLWCMALNATNLGPAIKEALRGRKSDFYTVSRLGAECRLLGFAEATDAFGWTWGQAMAISGAALAPTFDDQQNRVALTGLGTAGMNLGRWVKHATGEERKKFWSRLSRLFNIQKATPDSVFVTDGGHIENSGLYQLLRRRCSLMLAVDGSQDAETNLDVLANLEHLARVELDTRLVIDPMDLKYDDEGWARRHFFVIRVEYPDKKRGVIVYVKPTFTGDEPWYLKRYRDRNPDFPNDPLYVQSFDDRKFEAYLALGEHMGQSMLKVASRSADLDLSEGAKPVTFQALIESVVTEMMQR